MLPSRRSSSPEAAALRVAVMDICGQVESATREQVRLIRSGAPGGMSEADVQLLAGEIAAAARARLDAATQASQNMSADPELATTRREAAQVVVAAVREADAKLLQAWRSRHQKRSIRGWRR